VCLVLLCQLCALLHRAKKKKEKKNLQRRLIYCSYIDDHLTYSIRCEQFNCSVSSHPRPSRHACVCVCVQNASQASSNLQCPVRPANPVQKTPSPRAMAPSAVPARRAFIEHLRTQRQPFALVRSQIVYLEHSLLSFYVYLQYPISVSPFFRD